MLQNNLIFAYRKYVLNLFVIKSFTEKNLTKSNLCNLIGHSLRNRERLIGQNQGAVLLFGDGLESVVQVRGFFLERVFSFVCFFTSRHW